MPLAIVALVAVVSSAFTAVAQAKPQAVVYSTSAEPNARVQTLNLAIWDEAWFENGSSPQPDDAPAPTLKELCQQQSPFFISLVSTDGTPIAPGAFYAVTLGEVGKDQDEGGTPLPSKQALMGIAMPSGPMLAPRGAVVLQQLDAQAAKVTVAAYLPYPPNAPEGETYSYSETFIAKSCADILALDSEDEL